MYDFRNIPQFIYYIQSQSDSRKLFWISPFSMVFTDSLTPSDVAQMSVIIPYYPNYNVTASVILEGLSMVSQPTPTIITWLSAVAVHASNAGIKTWYNYSSTSMYGESRHFIDAYPKYLTYYAILECDMTLPCENESSYYRDDWTDCVTIFEKYSTRLSMSVPWLMDILLEERSTDSNSKKIRSLWKHLPYETLLISREINPEWSVTMINTICIETTALDKITIDHDSLKELTVNLYGILKKSSHTDKTSKIKVSLSDAAVKSIKVAVGENLMVRIITTINNATLNCRSSSNSLGITPKVKESTDPTIQKLTMVMIWLVELYPNLQPYYDLIRRYGVAGLIRLYPKCRLHHLLGLPLKDDIPQYLITTMLCNILACPEIHSVRIRDVNRVRYEERRLTFRGTCVMYDNRDSILFYYPPLDVTYTIDNKYVMYPSLRGQDSIKSEMEHVNMGDVPCNVPIVQMPVKELLEYMISNVDMVRWWEM